MFEFKIYDIQEKQSFNDDCELVVKQFGDTWLKYDLSISIKDIWVISTREYELINDDLDVKACTKVTLSDGTFVYAASLKPTFDKNYQEYIDKNNI
jgi:hypothetical protein